MGGIIDVFRSGARLPRERMRMVAFALLAASLIGAGHLIATSDGLNDRLGTDFSNVYTGDLCARRPADGAVRSRTTVRQPVLFRKPSHFSGSCAKIAA
jgi:hypothetical protein